jgi:hypothetical protein
MAKIGKDTRKNYRHQLRWFRIERYNKETLQGWSFRDWALQIAYRMDLIRAAEAWHNYDGGGWDEYEISDGEALYRNFRLIQKSPLLNFNSADFVFISPYEFPTLFSLLHLPGDVGLSIRPATVSEYFLHEYDLDDETMLYCRNFFSTTEEKDALECGEISSAQFKRKARNNYQNRWVDMCVFADSSGPFKTPYREILNEPMVGFTGKDANVMLLLDARASDRQIHDDLSVVLKRIRRRITTVASVRISLKSWIEVGLLPYMDLRVWAAVRGEGTLPTWIAKEKLGFDKTSAHVVPLRTRKLFDGLMSGKQRHWRQLLTKTENSAWYSHSSARGQNRRVVEKI